MSKVFIEESTLTSICDAVRAKNGTSEPIGVSDIATEISNITGGGSGDSELVKYVTFMNEDGTTELYRMPVLTGDDCKDPITHGDITTPTKDSTTTQTFAYSGWAVSSGGNADDNALKAVTEDKVVYSAFRASVRYYTVSLYDEDSLLTTLQVTYGADASSMYVAEKQGYKLTGWLPDITNVTSDVTSYAQWVVDDGVIYDSWETIKANCEAGNASLYKLGYTKTETITYADGTTEDVTFEIISKKAREKEVFWDSPHGNYLTFMATNVLSKKPAKSDITYQQLNSPVYHASQEYIENNIYPYISDDLKNAITPRQHMGSTYSLWCPPLNELTGTNASGNTYNDTYEGDFSLIVTDPDGEKSGYWLTEQTSRSSGLNTWYYLFFITDTGTATTSVSSTVPSDGLGIRLLFGI